MPVYGVNGLEKFERIKEHFSLNPTANFAEIGVFEGGVVKEISSIFPNCKIYAYDTFEGLPIEHFSEGEKFDPGTFKSQKDIHGELSDYHNIKPIRGIFPSTYENIDFWTVHLDVDYYEATKLSLIALLPNMKPGSAIFIDDLDDPCCFGIRKIYNEMQSTKDWHKLLSMSKDLEISESTTNQMMIKFL